MTQSKNVPGPLPATQNVTSVSEMIAAAQASGAFRPRPTFRHPLDPKTIERSVRHKYADVHSITVTLLRDSDECAAAERAPSAARIPFELAKAALYAVNDERVSLADGSTDRIWSEMHPNAKALVLKAYTLAHYPEDSEVDTFRSGLTEGWTTA